jgi:hypothetical protein
MTTFQSTDAEMLLIDRIVERADEIAQRSGQSIDRLKMHMDIIATHANGCPLRLSDLLAAPEADFAHDVFGIGQHIDRETGKLGDQFMPRYAAA